MPNDRSTPPSDALDRAWRQFPNTILHVGTASIDLRRPVTTTVLNLLDLTGLRQPFGVITAYNPMGTDSAVDSDATRNTRLHKTLISAGCRCVSVDACSPDRSHCEPSLAVLCECDALLSLARQYDQLAIFWFDGASFWLIPAHPGWPRIKLPTAQ